MLSISIVLDLTRTWLEPTIYLTQGKQANYYNTRHIIVNSIPKKANMQHKKNKTQRNKSKERERIGI